MSIFRTNVEQMEPYKPGEQPAAGTRVIKLNTNENPYPPSPRALAVLKEFDGEWLRRYPHPYAQRFREAVGKTLGFDPSWVLAGNGSDDLLTMVMRATAEPGRDVVIPMPTYVLYRTLAQIQAARCVEVPFDEDYRLPLEALVAACGAVTIIANPNSPSGTLTPLAVLEELAARCAGLVVIDEAYADFASANALELVRRHSNVLVLRTLSKGYSMAGLRLGFAVGNPALLEQLAKVKDSYNVDAVACAVGAAAFEDQAYVCANAQRVKASRVRMATELAGLGFQVWPSEANFVLARPPGGEAARIYQALKARGILVRYFAEPRLDDKLRITVGAEEENAQLYKALRELVQQTPTP